MPFIIKKIFIETGTFQSANDNINYYIGYVKQVYLYSIILIMHDHIYSVFN